MGVKEGYIQTEIGVIPTEWNIVKLGDIGEPIIGLTYKPENVRSNGLLVLRSSNIDEGKLSFSDNVFVDVDIPVKLFVKENDVLICVRNGSRNLIGKCAIIDSTAEGMTFGAFMSIFRSEFGKFVFYQFQSDIIKKQINENIGATINQITNKNLDAFSIPLPPLPEQHAIAEALSDADALIDSLERLIAKKRAIRQGTMQQLLTGQRRLPGFSGEWVYTKLGDVVIINKGQLITEIDAVPGSVPVIAGGKAPAYFHNTANHWQKTITISGSGANAGYVSFHTIPIFASDCSTIDEGEAYSIEFIFYLLILIQSKIYNAQTGGAQPHIHPNDLNPLLIFIPIDKAEQTAIAEVLSDMDAEIDALTAKLSKARSLKQGMMQQLLTGRIRLC